MGDDVFTEFSVVVVPWCKRMSQTSQWHITNMYSSLSFIPQYSDFKRIQISGCHLGEWRPVMVGV